MTTGDLLSPADFNALYTQQWPKSRAAISLWQPWGSLIFAGVKLHETRHWPIPRGLVGARVVAHAAKTTAGFRDVHPALEAICRRCFGDRWRLEMPLGCALGLVTLDSCAPTELVREKLDDVDRECGNYEDGRFVWRLSRPEAFAKPIPMKRRQGFWSVPEVDLK